MGSFWTDQTVYHLLVFFEFGTAYTPKTISSKLITHPGNTFAVATWPSVSSLSIVPVGKYGTIAVNDRANSLWECKQMIKKGTNYCLPILQETSLLPKVMHKASKFLLFSKI